MERNWIKEAYAQEITGSEQNILSTQIPSDETRAMFFGVRFFDTPLAARQDTFYTAFKFEHITDDLPIDGKIPTKLQVSPVQFTLESLPSLEKRDFYHLLNGYIRSEGPFTDPFGVEVDVVAGNGKVIQIWEYGECMPVFYKTYVQDTLFFYQFHGKHEPEIREKSGYNCSFYTVRPAGIDQHYFNPYELDE
jgi:hypothetical protein